MTDQFSPIQRSFPLSSMFPTKPQAFAHRGRKEVMKSNNAKIYQFPSLKKKVKSEASKKRTRRFNAFITDLLFIQVFQKLAVFSYIEFINQSFFTLPFGVKANLMGNLSQMRTSTMFFTYFSYFLVAAYLFEGKTIGKSIFELRIVSRFHQGENISFRDSFLRSVGYTISYMFLFLPFLASAFSKNGKGLPDYLSQTEVMTEVEFLQYKKDLIVDVEKEKAIDLPAQTPQNDASAKQLDLFAA